MKETSHFSDDVDAGRLSPGSARLRLSALLLMGAVSCAHHQEEEPVIAPYRSTKACPSDREDCRPNRIPVHTAPPPAYGNRIVKTKAAEPSPSRAKNIIRFQKKTVLKEESEEGAAIEEATAIRQNILDLQLRLLPSFANPFKLESPELMPGFHSLMNVKKGDFWPLPKLTLNPLFHFNFR